MKKDAFDVQHPFFKPLWLRVLILLLCFSWAGFEYSNGNVFWALLFGACGVYLGHEWLVVFDPDKMKEPGKTKEKDKE